jgi:hypothetical protein
MKKVIFLTFTSCMIFLLGHDLFAQGEQQGIIFSGVVVGGKKTDILPGAYIFIPKAGTGTLAHKDGSFSIRVFPGDSIVYSYVGYKKQYHIIPRNYNANTYSAIVSLQEDVMLLSEVKIYPYSTEEEFKRAFLALKLPDQADRDALAKSTNPEYIKRLAEQVANNAQTNYRYTMDQQMFGRESAAGKGFATTFPFLDPFRIAKFIKSVKNGDLKQQEWRKALNAAPPESINKYDVLKKNGEFEKPEKEEKK